MWMESYTETQIFNDIDCYSLLRLSARDWEAISLCCSLLTCSCASCERPRTRSKKSTQKTTSFSFIFPGLYVSKLELRGGGAAPWEIISAFSGKSQVKKTLTTIFFRVLVVYIHLNTKYLTVGWKAQDSVTILLLKDGPSARCLRCCSTWLTSKSV